MPLDPNIILGIKPSAVPQIRDPMEEYGKRLTLQSLIGQSQDEDAVRSAYQQAGGDNTRLRALLQGGGQYKQLQALDKFDLENKAKQAEISAHEAAAGKSNYETQIGQIQHGSAILSTAKDQGSWDQARRVMSLTFPAIASQLPQQYDPAFVQAKIAAGQTMAQKLEDERKQQELALKGANEPFAASPNGPVANTPVQNFQIEKAKKSAPVTNVSLSTEKKYGEQFAGEMAKADASMRDTALKAPDLAQRANQIKEVLSSGKVITGTGADYRLALGKALNLVGANDGETVANTETLATQLARNTLDAIKASGLGSGSGFSNADRDFLEKAVGGKLSLQPETIDRLATLAHRSAEQSAKKWGDRVKNIPSDALKGTGLDVEQIKVPPIFTAPVKPSGAQSNIRLQADAILAGGK